MGAFEVLNDLNINGHTEKKNVSGKDLTYLSWPWAWAEVKKRYPEAHYTIWKNADGLPYTEDPMTGYMVYTSVTIDGNTHEMWLPVMDGANRAMKRMPYKYTTKYGEKSVEAATMMDINKTIMRCLVKNLAMFGLGLYIYAGEDLPETEKDQETESQAPEKSFTPPTSSNNKGTVEVTVTSKLPPAANIEKPKPEPTAVQIYLMKAMKQLREDRGISVSENNKLFAAQFEALVNAGLAPKKKTEEYTIEEAEALIDAMYKKFPPNSAELKKQ